MTKEMMEKIQNARAMMKKRVKGISGYGKLFNGADYERMRGTWDTPTPTWNTLKKYAAEAGLVQVHYTYKWHNDGTLLCALAGIPEGKLMHATAWRFD